MRSAAPAVASALQRADDRLECFSGDPDERRRDEEQPDEIGLEANVAAAADVCAERNGDASTTAAAPLIALLVAAATAAEAVVAERDRNHLGAVDVDRLTV